MPIRETRVKSSVQRLRRSLPRRDADDGIDAPFDVGVGRGPRNHADPRRRSTLPHRGAAPARSISLDSGDDARRSLGVAKRNQHLVEHHLIQYLTSGRREPLGKSARLAAIALDQLRESGSAERPQRRPDLDAARAAGSPAQGS